MSSRRVRRRLLGAGLGAVLPRVGHSVAATSDATASAFGSLSEALAALRGGAGVATVAPGEHRIRNPIVVHGLSGLLRFAPGSRLVVTDTSAGGLRFVRCNGLTIEGLHLVWPEVPRVRSHFGAGLMFVLGTRIVVRDLTVDGAVGAGLHVDTCREVRLDDIRVSSTRADGIHFANCAEVVASNLSTRDTGDDGVACVDYERAPQGGPHVLRDVRVEDSAARGIAIVGASRVELTGFQVRRTASSGVLIATDRHYGTRRPNGVRVRDGVIVEAGVRTPPAGNRFGVEAIEAGDVELVRLVVLEAATRSISIVRVDRTVRIEGLRVETGHGGDPAVELHELAEADILGLVIRAARPPLLDVRQVSSLRVEDLDLTVTADGEPRAAATIAGPGRIELDGLRVSGAAATPVLLRRDVVGWLRVDPEVAVRVDSLELRVDRLPAPSDQAAGRR